MPNHVLIPTGFLQFLLYHLFFFQLFNNGKAVQKTTTSEIKEMIANHDIEKIVVVNKDQAEIYLKKEALESGRYPKLPKPGTGFGICSCQNQITLIILVI